MGLVRVGAPEVLSLYGFPADNTDDTVLETRRTKKLFPAVPPLGFSNRYLAETALGGRSLAPFTYDEFLVFGLDLMVLTAY